MRRSSLVPLVAPKDVQYQRRQSHGSNAEYERRISLVAEQAQERLRGLMGGNGASGASGDSHASERRMSAGDKKGVSPNGRRPSGAGDHADRQSSIKKGSESGVEAQRSSLVGARRGSRGQGYDS